MINDTKIGIYHWCLIHCYLKISVDLFCKNCQRNYVETTKFLKFWKKFSLSETLSNLLHLLICPNYKRLSWNCSNLGIKNYQWSVFQGKRRCCFDAAVWDCRISLQCSDTACHSFNIQDTEVETDLWGWGGRDRAGGGRGVLVRAGQRRSREGSGLSQTGTQRFFRLRQHLFAFQLWCQNFHWIKDALFLLGFNGSSIIYSNSEQIYSQCRCIKNRISFYFFISF